MRLLQQYIDADDFAELQVYDTIEGVPHPVREAGQQMHATIAIQSTGGSPPNWRDCMGLKKRPTSIKLDALQMFKRASP